jgi:transposase-like protein
MESHTRLIFDGTFLHRPVSVIALMDGVDNKVMKGKYGVNENSTDDLLDFFLPLQERGLEPVSVTVDGNPQAMRTIRMLWPGVILQRCLVHIQRQGIMWCRRPPKRTDAKRLRELFRRVTYIYTNKDRDRFVDDLKTWEHRYGGKIDGQPERGRVFSDIKRARSMLLKALPDMFHYLEDGQIPSTTNALEGYFSRLKRDYREHRGLHPAKRNNYFNWYFHLKPK